jgi:hypothetical protein
MKAWLVVQTLQRSSAGPDWWQGRAHVVVAQTLEMGGAGPALCKAGLDLAGALQPRGRHHPPASRQTQLWSLMLWSLMLASVSRCKKQQH